MASKAPPQTLAGPQEALSNYLDSLLSEIAPPDVEAPSVAPVSLPSPLQPVPEPSPAAKPPHEAVRLVEPAAEEPAEAVTAQEDDVPAWAGNTFQCLTFVVAGVTLAAPLDKLFGIVDWQGEMTELPGYAPWFMGLMRNRGQNVQLVDIAQVIMPDGRLPDKRPVWERLKFVVLIDEGRWGLAADKISQVLTLSSDDVRWRSARSKRPWLAGTAVEQMCAVLDVTALSEQLAAGLKDK